MRTADALQTEQIMGLLREHFTVVYPQEGRATEPTFVPGYGKWAPGWSDENVAIEVGVSSNTVSRIRKAHFGHVHIDGTTAYVAPAEPARADPTPNEIMAHCLAMSMQIASITAVVGSLQGRVAELEELLTAPDAGEKLLDLRLNKMLTPA